MIRIITICLLGAMIFIVACNGKRNLVKTGSGTQMNSVVDIQGVWLKDKTDKFDLGIKITNKTTQPILISKGNLTCGRDSLKGSVYYTSIDSMGQQWLFEANETKEFYIICKLPQMIKTGQFSFGIRQVYTNKNADGVTRGNSL